MPIYLHSSEIDFSKWDKCIAQSSNPSVFSLSWYLQATAENWGGIIDGDYEAVTPVCYTEKLGFKKAVQPVFTRSFDFFSTQYKLKLSGAYKAHLQNTFKKIDVAFPVIPSEIKSIGTTTKKVYQALDLQANYSDIAKRYSENARRMLKKYETKPFSIYESVDFRPLLDLFTTAKAKELGFGKTQLTRLNKLMDAAVKADMGNVLSVFNSDRELVASGFFIHFQGTLLYLKGTATEEGKKSGAMYKIFDHIIEKNSGGSSVLDFGGSNVTSVATFYKKFGAYDVPYYLYQQGTEPLYIRAIKKLRKNVKRR